MVRFWICGWRRARAMKRMMNRPGERYARPILCRPSPRSTALPRKKSACAFALKTFRESRVRSEEKGVRSEMQEDAEHE